MSTSKYLLAAGLAATAVAACAVVAPAGAGADPSAPVVVVSGLNNPRQLSLNGNHLLIAEAGKGGDTEVGGGPEGPEFVGYSGSVSEVLDPASAEGTSPDRVVTGLLSAAGSPDGLFAVGSDGASRAGRSGAIYVQETYAPPDVLPAAPTSAQVGRLLRAAPNGTLNSVANISKFEAVNDPDGHGFDSNPYAVLDLGGGHELVADAAGNDVLSVDHGALSVFHVFPNITGGKCAGQFDPTPDFPGCNFVPTSLARDAAGNVYVGGLGSEVPKQGKVVELSADGSQVLKTWTGFRSVSGVAVGPDGSVYVSQLEAREANAPFPMVKGVVTRVARGNVRTNTDVPFPAGIAVDADSNVYVAAWSVSPDTGLAGPGTDGQVWRLHF